MGYSVKIINKSGNAQNIAIFIKLPSGSYGYSLVWRAMLTNAEGSCEFSWDERAFGLGWGVTNQIIAMGVKFISGQSAKVIYPFKSDGVNAIDISYKNGSFIAGEPYLIESIINTAEIKSDNSFKVSDASKMFVSFYVDKIPALIMQGAPNTRYFFDLTSVSYYLTVTDLGEGQVLPLWDSRENNDNHSRIRVSVSTPEKMPFTSGINSLKYILDSTLDFIPG